MSGEMTIPQGYKQTDIGVLPNDWQTTKIRECCRKITDGTHDTPKPVRVGIPFLTAIHVKDNWIDFESCLYLTPADHEIIFGRCNPQMNDVLMVNIGAGLATTALVKVEHPFSLKNVALLKPDVQRVRGSYLNHCLRMKRSSITRDLSSGGAQPFLSLRQIGDIVIPLPDVIAEQDVIAEALSDADALIESLEHLIAKKRQIKQGAMQDLLTGTKRLSGFGETWEEKSLGDLFSFSGGFSASRDQLSGTGYCYLHYGDIHKASKTYVDIQAEHQDIPRLDIPLKRISTTSLLEDGDVVFVDASEDDEGTSKYVVVVNKGRDVYISGLHTIVAKSKTEDLDHLYRRYCFQTTAIKRQFYFFAVGTKVSGISKKNIAKVLLPLPPLSEQTAIATILSDLDADIAGLETKLTKARQLKQGMMQELLTGRIRLVSVGTYKSES